MVGIEIVFFVGEFVCGIVGNDELKLFCMGFKVCGKEE